MEPLRQIEPEQFPLSNLRDDAAVVRRTTPGADGDPSAGAATAASGFVTAMYGAHTLSVPIAGLSAAAAYRELRELLHLPDSVFVLVDGRVASPDERIATGTTVEFVKRVGEKGVRSPCPR